MFSACLAISAHLMLPGRWNSIHPCLRYEEGPLIAGLYLNSESNLSTYLGVTHEWANGLFVEGGIVTGYSDAPISPFGRAGWHHGDQRYFIAPGLAKGQFGWVTGIEHQF